MRKKISIALLSLFVLSCSKQVDEPLLGRAKPGHASIVTSGDDTVATSVVFDATVPSTVYLTAGWNTIQVGDFFVSETAYISKFIFVVVGNPLLAGGKFYVDGGSFPATISYSNDTITVVAKSIIPLPPGPHSYILHAKTIGMQGSTFSMSLTTAYIADRQRMFFGSVTGLPQLGNKFIMN